MTALRDDVTADRRFELMLSSCALNCPIEGPALGDRLRAASQADAQILIIGIVRRSTTNGRGVRLIARGYRDMYAAANRVPAERS
jgi:hypothetical protein